MCASGRMCDDSLHATPFQPRLALDKPCHLSDRTSPSPCGMLVGCLWDACGMPVGCLWDACGMLVGCLWDACAWLAGTTAELIARLGWLNSYVMHKALSLRSTAKVDEAEVEAAAAAASAALATAAAAASQTPAAPKGLGTGWVSITEFDSGPTLRRDGSGGAGQPAPGRLCQCALSTHQCVLPTGPPSTSRDSCVCCDWLCQH